MPHSHLILFQGENHLALNQALKQWRKQFIDKHSEFNLNELTGPIKATELIETTQTIPFLATNRLIICHNFFALQDKDKTEAEVLLSKLEQIPTFSIVIFVETTSLDQRLKITKKINKEFTIKNFPATSSHNLPSWIQTEVNKHGQQLDYSLANNLSQQFHVHSDRLPQEINKLCTYSNDSNISPESIKTIISPPINDSVFDLIDEIFNPNSHSKINILHHLYQQGEDLIKLLFLITNHVRLLVAGKLANGNWQDLKDFKIHPFVQKKLQQKLPRLEKEHLLKIYFSLQQIDAGIKSGKLKSQKGKQEEILFALEKVLVKA